MFEKGIHYNWQPTQVHMLLAGMTFYLQILQHFEVDFTFGLLYIYIHSFYKPLSLGQI